MSPCDSSFVTGPCCFDSKYKLKLTVFTAVNISGIRRAGYVRTKLFKKELSVSARAKSVYKAITEEIDQWWTIDSNKAFNVGDILTVRFGEPYYMSMEVEKIIFNKLLVWKVVAANMFIEGGRTNNDEWVGTKIQWKISESENGSEVALFHEGLVPSFECYDTCINGWDYFLGSLKEFLDTGNGRPHTTAIENNGY